MKQHIVINTDGTTETRDGKPTLKELQTAVGGYIERVRVRYDGKLCDMVINEEGLLQNLPLNLPATALYPAPIRGTVVILQGCRL